MIRKIRKSLVSLSNFFSFITSTTLHFYLIMVFTLTGLLDILFVNNFNNPSSY